MKEFLLKIKRINCGRKAAIFLDNASIHRSKQILEFCENL
jgi:transposase